MANEAENPEIVELRKLLQQTIKLVNQNAKDNAYLRGAFEQMDKRFDDLTAHINQRFEQVDKRFDDLTANMNQRFEQVDKRFESLIAVMNQRFEQVDKRLEKVEERLSELDRRFTEAYQSQLKWIIGLLVPLWMALIALVVKSFLGS